MRKLFLFGVIISSALYLKGQDVSSSFQESYLSNLKVQLQKKWPENRTINLVFHGHSVPSGYFNTPNVNSLQAYPQQTLIKLKEQYPFAVINVIVTAIGGENSVQGEKRFKKDVLSHHPDILFIDYALNDRNLDLEKMKKAWVKMIKMALHKNIKVILFTPTPDLIENILSPESPLEKHSAQIRMLAKEYKTGLVDSYAAFKKLVQGGAVLKDYMAQSNHPNAKGHEIVVNEIMKYFNKGN